MRRLFVDGGEKKFFSLQIFAEEETDSEDTGEGDDQDEEEDSDEAGEEEEKKFSQKDVDEAVKKRLAREKRKWQRQQQKRKLEGGTDDGDPEKEKPGKSDTEKAKEAAESKASKLEMKVACYEAGVAKDSVDDVVALAHSYMTADEDLDLEDAIEKVVKKYPQFKKTTLASGENDGEEETKGKSWGQRQKGKGSKKLDGIEEAFLKKNPGLKV